MYQVSRGIDESPLVEQWVVKSIGREWTFEKDTRDRATIHKTLELLAKDVHGQLKAEGFLAKTVTIKVRYQNFETHTSQKTLKEHTDSLEKCVEVAKDLLKPYFEKPKKIRLIGYRLTKLKEKK